MSTIASATAGNWSDTATWTGSVVPGPNDTATINHAVTLDANATVGGIDPASTGTLLATNSQLRLLVGAGGRPTLIGKPLVL
ncbi:MAG TPA: hypothetical protein VH253_06305 [Phycisphaerae bacterium]|nr:hypothetical protein [Phycisphaerae bacterium]